ncbi:(d)CMP kinase [uncultured Oscillibacter sp.]|uniref:(d)CMP kinase n=1 Tax=uncultured Oscillibacter sp. TaxID=876091 RepID=UPI002636F7BF|nr:(d)CMP kinase [uncultured Oscillibacter sp.]
MSTIRVAIDGPSGAGKSSLARAAAATLGFLYVDTGAIYRTVGLSARDRGVDPGDEAAVAAMLPALQVELRYDGAGQQKMFLNGRDVSGEIRLPEISRYASAVSALPVVRAYLMETQRELARKNNVVMDGRDIGTVVLPDAEAKIFLTASAKVRAERRCRELEERGTPQPFEEVLRDIEDRDFRDTHREAAPLRQAEGAALLDTSALDFQQSLEALLEIIQERTGL